MKLDNAEKETLLLLTQFARRPGVRLYHYSTLTTLDENERPYSRLRSPAVIRPLNILIEELEKQISGQIPTRYSKERLEEVKSIDIKYKDTIEKHAWQFVFLEETSSKNHQKRSLQHLKRNQEACLVCLEALVVMSENGPTIQRGTKDIIFDINVDTISQRGDPLYDHRSARYMLLLADTHLASYEDKEARYYETVFDIWTATHSSITSCEQKEKGPIERLEDFPFFNREEGLKFTKKHNMGTIGIKDPFTGKPTAIPSRFDVNLNCGQGVFWTVDLFNAINKEFHEKTIKNVEKNNPFVSICSPAFGMKYELGIAIEGELSFSAKEIDIYQEQNNISGPIGYIIPKRITNISTPVDRRGKIIYSEWD